MTPEEEIEALFEETAWLKELIEEAIEDTGMSVFEEQQLRNMIKYYKIKIARLEKLKENNPLSLDKIEL